MWQVETNVSPCEKKPCKPSPVCDFILWPLLLWSKVKKRLGQEEKVKVKKATTGGKQELGLTHQHLLLWLCAFSIAVCELVFVLQLRAGDSLPGRQQHASYVRVRVRAHFSALYCGSREDVRFLWGFVGLFWRSGQLAYRGGLELLFGSQKKHEVDVVPPNGLKEVLQSHRFFSFKERTSHTKTSLCWFGRSFDHHELLLLVCAR